MNNILIFRKFILVIVEGIPAHPDPAGQVPAAAEHGGAGGGLPDLPAGQEQDRSGLRLPHLLQVARGTRMQSYFSCVLPTNIWPYNF